MGGLVGLNRSSGAIRSSSSGAAVTTADLDQAGGLVGENEGSIDDSYATGSVNGRNSVAGLVGRNDGTGGNDWQHHRQLRRRPGHCPTATGPAAWWPTTPAGFIIAGYATGAVSGRNDVGGLVGTSYGGGTATVRVIASFSTGAVSRHAGTTSAASSAPTPAVSVVNNSYWNTETSGQSTSAAGTGLYGAGAARPHRLHGHLRQLERGPGRRHRGR